MIMALPIVRRSTAQDAVAASSPGSSAPRSLEGCVQIMKSVMCLHGEHSGLARRTRRCFMRSKSVYNVSNRKKRPLGPLALVQYVANQRPVLFCIDVLDWWRSSGSNTVRDGKLLGTPAKATMAIGPGRLVCLWTCAI